MILPTKHVPTSWSLLGIGGVLLGRLDQPLTVSMLWDRVRSVPEVATFERFMLALCLLFSVGAVELDGGRLQRGTK